MFTIFDLMRPGAGMDAMARQFGLTQDQAQRATEALLPAFMLGLQRSAGNPNAFANLMGAAAPSTSQPQAAGSQALGQLFGPPELTRQIAEQAAHWSGVSAQVMQQMMPIVAGAVIGGLSKFSEVMRDQAASPQAAAGNAAATPYAAWADMMRTMLGGSSAAAPTPQAEPAAPPGGSSPVDAWADMIRTMTGQAPVAPEPAPTPAPPPPAEARRREAAGGMVRRARHRPEGAGAVSRDAAEHLRPVLGRAPRPGLTGGRGAAVSWAMPASRCPLPSDLASDAAGVPRREARLVHASRASARPRLRPSNRQDLRGVLVQGLEQRAFDVGAQEADVLQRPVVEVGEPHHLAPVAQRREHVLGAPDEGVAPPGPVLSPVTRCRNILTSIAISSKVVR